ncbi:MAG: DNA-directed RNA polymerase subunit B [archaeon]
MKTPIFLDGKLIGFHSNPIEFVRQVRDKRRMGKLHWTLNIAYIDGEIRINTGPGRILRPLIIVENGKSKLTPEHIKLIKQGVLGFYDLLKNGIIEFLDAEEEENAYVALDESELTSEHTHLEIHPASINSISAINAPFQHHNSSTRILMAAKMMNQAIGIYSNSYRTRFDKTVHVLHYPQTPIVKTKYSQLTKHLERPNGQNFVIAVLSHPYNTNDAVILNKAAVERGLGCSTKYETLKTEEMIYFGGQRDKIEKPKENVIGYLGENAYRYLDENGIIDVGCEVEKGDVLVGKTSPPRFLEEISELEVLKEKRIDTSLTIDSIPGGEKEVIDAVLIVESGSGNRQIKIRTRRYMRPELGDKFTARHGQKGVVAALVDACDMPFSETGIIPDLLINPHAIPSRMTYGFLLETLGGKVGALSGREVDGTCFDSEKEVDLKAELEKLGFKSNGYEIFYDGVTGQMMQAEVFTGVVYYLRLRHLVSLKMQARAKGPVQMLTRQPTEGKQRTGGLRVGEMETHCLIAHGAALLLKERLLEESDKTTLYVCKTCKTFAINDLIRKRKYCKICGGSEVYEVDTGYAFKLLLELSLASGIYPKINLGDICE